MLVNRNVALVVGARFISRTGAEAAFFLGIWGKAAFEFEAGPGQLALVMAVLGLSVMAGSALSGVAIDRFGPKRVMIFGEILFVPATLSVLLAGDIIQLTLLVGLLGFFGAPVLTAVGSFAPYITEDNDDLRRANAFVEAAGQGSIIAGPAIGAIIASQSSLDWVFVFDAATSVVALVLILGVVIQPIERGERSNSIQQMLEGLSYVYGSRQLRFYVLLSTALWFMFGFFASLEPLFFRDVLHQDIETLGWVLAIFGVGLVGGSLLLSRLPSRFTSARSVALLIAANAVGALLYVGTDRLPVVVVGGLVWGVIIGLFQPMARTFIHLNSPDMLIGRIQGTVQVHASGGELLPLTFAPVLAAAFGVQPVLLGAGVAVGIIGLLSVKEGIALDRIRDKKVPPPQTLRVEDEPISPTP